MISRYILFFGCLLPCLLSFSAKVGNSQHLGESCSNDTTYNSSSASGKTYRTNLNFLLSTLTSNASDQPNGFYNFTAGSDPSNRVYGLFLCRGDANTNACQECVERASSDILQRCPDRKIATIWYDNCMLRYSNQYIFSRMEGFYGLPLGDTSNATDVVLFSQVVQDTMEQIADRASNDLSGKKFAVQEANYSTSQSRRIYALGQCTPDLSSLDCGTCLRSAISYLPTYRQGGRFLCPSCNIRYEVYPFYDILATPPPSPLSPASSKDNGRNSTLTIVAIVVPICVSIALFVVIFCIVRRYRKAYNVIVETTGTSDDISFRESLQYSLSEIQACTNNFAVDNRIGGGGFGSVYKGTLPNGREIAVKRLSRSSSQGAQEFINEIALLAKLQHRNLVRLLGYCLEGEERILVYEFVPNRSLDYFLFDPEKQPLLDWSKRYKIIGGIARGLLYLHEDSRLAVIHRDLKASNVLLDQNMNPKIADFGMARLFEDDQSAGNTNKIVGTYGYMPPEYAMHGMFSVKSDVFSFGVLILEIISGKRNIDFFQSHGAYLLSNAWRQWRDETPLALLDTSIGDSDARNEVIQCIHIGLLCVQDDAEQRPTMASVVLMLNSFTLTMPTPNPPAFFGHNRTGNFFSKELSESDKSSTNKSVPEFSRNDASITELYPR